MEDLTTLSISSGELIQPGHEVRNSGQQSDHRTALSAPSALTPVPYVIQDSLLGISFPCTIFSQRLTVGGSFRIFTFQQAQPGYLQVRSLSGRLGRWPISSFEKGEKEIGSCRVSKFVCRSILQVPPILTSIAVRTECHFWGLRISE